MHGYAIKNYGHKAKQKAVPSDFSLPGRFWGVWGVKEVNPVVATTRPIRDELVGFCVKMAIDKAEKSGLKVFTTPSGFVAFPDRRGGCDEA